MSVFAIAMLLLAAFNYILLDPSVDSDKIVFLSHGVAVIFCLVYLGYLAFEIKQAIYTHGNIGDITSSQPVALESSLNATRRFSADPAIAESQERHQEGDIKLNMSLLLTISVVDLTVTVRICCPPLHGS